MNRTIYDSRPVAFLVRGEVLRAARPPSLYDQVCGKNHEKSVQCVRARYLVEAEIEDRFFGRAEDW